jgi:hypothetical protein
MKLWELENRQMKRTTKNAARKGQLAVIRRDDHKGCWRILRNALSCLRRYHVLPSGFHRIRHYWLIANAGRAQRISHGCANYCT